MNNENQENEEKIELMRILKGSHMRAFYFDDMQLSYNYRLIFIGQVYRGFPSLCLPYSIASLGQRLMQAIQCVQSFPHTGFPFSSRMLCIGHTSAHFPQEMQVSLA